MRYEITFKDKDHYGYEITLKHQDLTAIMCELIRLADRNENADNDFLIEMKNTITELQGDDDEIEKLIKFIKKGYGQ